MKNLFIAFLSVFFLTTAQAGTIKIVNNTTKEFPQYFRDVSAKSKLNIAIDSAISRGILSKGSFFRPNAEVPAIMFLDTILRDAGFEPKSREFSDVLAEAVEQEIISPEIATNLQFDTPMTNLRIIEALIKTKKIIPPRRLSQKFRAMFPFTDLVKSRDIPYVEAAVASGILTEAELKFFQPNKLATRREFVSWIYNYFVHGTRNSKMEADQSFRRNQRSFRYNSNLRSRFSIEKRNTQVQQIRDKQKQEKKLLNKNPAKNSPLKILENGEIEKLSTIENSFPGRETMDEVYNEIIARYRFIDDLTEEKKQDMIDKALNALVESLGDKYSNYIKPAKSEEYLNYLDGEFEGIGAYVEMISGDFTIVAPLAGSPAEKAGLLPGDTVIQVDETDVTEMSTREIIDLIMGPAGTNVNLKISRDFLEHEFTITRAKITEPVVVLKWEKSVPIVEIHQFTNDTIELLENPFEEILTKGSRGIVLDLRNNPGGLLQSAIDVSSLFLKEGETILYIEDRSTATPFITEKDGKLANFTGEIVVLENSGTASASEILISMLQDHKNIKVIGEKSRGKGTVQTVRDLKNGGVLKLTIAKWLTPNKRWIHETGIVPDIKVPRSTIEELKKGIDRQLNAAVREVLH